MGRSWASPTFATASGSSSRRVRRLVTACTRAWIGCPVRCLPRSEQGLEIVQSFLAGGRLDFARDAIALVQMRARDGHAQEQSVQALLVFPLESSSGRDRHDEAKLRRCSLAICFFSTRTKRNVVVVQVFP